MAWATLEMLRSDQEDTLDMRIKQKKMTNDLQVCGLSIWEDTMPQLRLERMKEERWLSRTGFQLCQAQDAYSQAKSKG